MKSTDSNALRIRRRGAPRLSVRPIDLGQQRRQKRGPRRNLDDFERRAGGQRQIREPAADVERDAMARARTLPFRQKVDREIALLRVLAQIIMADKAVEVEWRGRSRIGLDRDELGQRLQPSAANISMRSVSSTVAPWGRSSTTWISDLLSKGSSLTRTASV